MKHRSVAQFTLAIALTIGQFNSAFASEAPDTLAPNDAPPNGSIYIFCTQWVLNPNWEFVENYKRADLIQKPGSDLFTCPNGKSFKSDKIPPLMNVMIL